MAEQVNKVPSLRFPEFEGEWSKRRLGDTGTVITGSTPSTSHAEYYGGDKQFVSPTDIQGNRYVKLTKTTLTELGFSKGRLVKAESVLFVCIGSTIGKVAQAYEDCISNQQINSIFANGDYDNGFILSVLERQSPKIKLLAGVQAVPQINKTDFSNLRFLFPSLSEQQKIADFLTAVDKRIEQLEEKKRLLTEYKKGVMQQIFSQKIRFKDDNGNPYPDWQEKRLGDVASFIKDGTHGTHKDCPEGEYYLLSAKNIRNNKVAFDDSDRRISQEEYKSIYKNYSLQANDILLTVVGSIGRVALAQDLTKIAFQRSVAFFRFDNESPNYIAHFFISSAFQKELIRRQVVSAQPGIYLGDLEKMQIQLPSIQEQQKIANFLTSVDNKIEQVGAQLEQAKTFKKGLLQQMFV